jgi:hypothetical protein
MTPAAVEIHDAGWEPVLLLSSCNCTVWRLGSALTTKEEALARAQQELADRTPDGL